MSKQKKIMVFVMISMLIFTMVPMTVSAASEKMKVTSTQVTNIHDGDSFWVTTNSGKPTLKFQNNQGANGGNRVKVTITAGSKKQSFDSNYAKNWFIYTGLPKNGAFKVVKYKVTVDFTYAALGNEDDVTLSIKKSNCSNVTSFSKK